MGYTVLGFFEEHDDAQQAVGKLVKEGFDEDHVDLSPYRTDGTYEANDYDFEEEEETSGFWDWVFGDDDDEKKKHSRVGARSVVVTAYVDEKDDAEKAASVLDEYGALDVDRRNQELGFAANDSDNENLREGRGDIRENRGTTTTRSNETLREGNENLSTNGQDTSSELAYNENSGELNEGTPVLDDQRPVSGNVEDHSLRNTKDSLDDLNDDTTKLGNKSNIDKVDSDNTIPIVEEDIDIEKRKVEDGGVSIKSRIIEKPVEENVRLRKERVYVTRKPVDRTVDSNDAFQEETLEMKETSEEAVVDKKARVVEEISLDKEVSEEEKTISDTVRKTEIDVDEK